MELSPPNSTGKAQPKVKSVVIVDDCSITRAWLRAVLESNPKLRVVGEAGTAMDAREVIKATSPDVITLDIEMPGMNGLAFLRRLMALRPMPVVIVAGAVSTSSEASIAALSMGAMDCIPKPEALLDRSGYDEISYRVLAAAEGQVLTGMPMGPNRRRSTSLSQGRLASRVLLVGASTGGVGALEVLLPALDPDGPPVVVAQHMPQMYLASFASRLNQMLPQSVGIAEAGVALRPGDIRFAPASGAQTEVLLRKGRWHCSFRPNTENARHSPSVNALFASAVPDAQHVCAVILTGLGSDGAQGLLALRQRGARTFGQDRESSVVYGMPKAAWQKGAVEQQLPLEKLGRAIFRVLAQEKMSISAGCA